MGLDIIMCVTAAFACNPMLPSYRAATTKTTFDKPQAKSPLSLITHQKLRADSCCNIHVALLPTVCKKQRLHSTGRWRKRDGKIISTPFGTSPRVIEPT